MRSLLGMADLSAATEAAANEPDADAVFRAVEKLAQKAIGHRLFTVMRFHAAAGDVERIYSSRPDAYPLGGRKPKSGTPWGRQVLDRGEIFLAATPDAVRAAFADHELIFSLGIGAILNAPVRFRGRSLGTLNLCHEAGWFHDADAAPARVLALLLVPPLLALPRKRREQGRGRETVRAAGG